MQLDKPAGKSREAPRQTQAATTERPDNQATKVAGGNRRTAWGLLLGIFFCLSIGPLWICRFPPMQDYPQHLFMAQVIHSYHDLSFDYGQNYEIHLQPSYASFYLLTLFFSHLLPVELAGKLTLTLYLALVAILVVRLGRRVPDSTPWGALLLFPLAFNQQYFLGNVNYLLALPILVLALLDFEDLPDTPGILWPILRQGLWQAALFITHPFAFDVYVALALLTAVMVRQTTTAAKVKLWVCSSVALLLLATSWALSRGTSSAEVQSPTKISWSPLKDTTEFFICMFNGMHGYAQADWTALAEWSGILALVIGSLVIDWKAGRRPPLLHAIFFLVTIIGMFLLPFRIGTYTYINPRVAAISYFICALLVARVQFKGWRLCCLIALTGACLVGSAMKQVRISAEVAEIGPIVRAVPANSRILPLVFDIGSPELDLGWFDMHLHDSEYCLVSAGGGFDPYLPQSPLSPVRYRPGAERPVPGEYHADRFLWERHSADYRYFVVRQAPAGLDEYLSKTCKKVRSSGEWTLFERNGQ